MIRLDDLTVGYDEPVVSGVSVTVERGDLMAVLGPNGVGKSTLLRTVLGLRRPLSGTVTLDGDDVTALDRRETARRLGYVPQSESDGLPSTVFETVLSGRRPHATWRPSAADRAVVGEVLAEAGLSDLAMRSVTTLSGGQRQRVRLARALAQEPAGLVLDEPTSSLDVRHRLDVLERVRALVDDGVAALFALHDLDSALRFADRVLVLHDGGVAAAGEPDVVTADLIERVYGIRATVATVDGRPVVVPE